MHTHTEDPYSLTPGNFNDERDIPVDDIYDDFRNSEMQIADLRVKEVVREKDVNPVTEFTYYIVPN